MKRRIKPKVSKQLVMEESHQMAVTKVLGIQYAMNPFSNKYVEASTPVMPKVNALKFVNSGHTSSRPKNFSKQNRQRISFPIILRSI